MALKWYIIQNDCEPSELIVNMVYPALMFCLNSLKYMFYKYIYILHYLIKLF